MHDTSVKPIRSKPWLVSAAIFTVVLLATLGMAPIVWYRLLPHIEPHLRTITLFGGSAAALLLGLKAWSAGPRHKRGALALVALGTAAVAGLLLTFFADATPAGKLHVIEYGILAYITLNGLNITRIQDRVLWIALAVLLAIGVLDEGIQYLLPNRYFDLMDIVGNWMATGLGLVFWVACSKHSPWRRAKSI